MNQEKRHRDLKNDPDGFPDLIFSNAKIPWEKSKEEVWNNLEGQVTKESFVNSRT